MWYGAGSAATPSWSTLEERRRMANHSEQTSPVSAHLLLPYDPAGYSDADGYLVECPDCYAVIRHANVEAHAQRCPARAS